MGSESSKWNIALMPPHLCSNKSWISSGMLYSRMSENQQWWWPTGEGKWRAVTGQVSYKEEGEVKATRQLQGGKLGELLLKWVEHRDGGILEDSAPLMQFVGKAKYPGARIPFKNKSMTEPLERNSVSSREEKI